MFITDGKICSVQSALISWYKMKIKIVNIIFGYKMSFLDKCSDRIIVYIFKKVF